MKKNKKLLRIKVGIVFSFIPSVLTILLALVYYNAEQYQHVPNKDLGFGFIIMLINFPYTFLHIVFQAINPKLDYFLVFLSPFFYFFIGYIFVSILDRFFLNLIHIGSERTGKENNLTSSQTISQARTNWGVVFLILFVSSLGILLGEKIFLEATKLYLK